MPFSKFLFKDFDADMQNYVLGQTLMAMSEAVIVGSLQDEDCPVIFFNQPFLDLSLRKPEEITGKPLLGIIRDLSEDPKTKDKITNLLMKREINRSEVEVERDGNVVWLDFQFQYARKNPVSNQPELLMAIISNITRNSYMQEMSAQSQKLEALGKLAGGVAHDFNNLMSIIDGYAHIALKHIDSENPEAVNALERIIQAVARGAGLTSQLLTYGRHKSVIETVISLGDVINEQKALLLPLMTTAIEIKMNVEEDLYIDCTQDTISQILINLCANAKDAMRDGGQLTISAYRCPKDEVYESLDKNRSYACLKISDTGTGIPEDVIGSIFDPFFTTKGQGEGTGLGLSMVLGLVKQMHGHIDVKSQPGIGTDFILYIPISDHQPIRKITHAEGDPSKIRFEGYTILVAEDEPDLRSVLKTMLEDMGMKVLTAENGNEALVEQEDFEGEIDFLLTDVVMPKLNGVKLASLFQSVRPSTKILFMSGYPANTDTDPVNLPKDAYLIPKPIQYDKLAYILNKLGNSDKGKEQDALKRMAGL